VGPFHCVVLGNDRLCRSAVFDEGGWTLLRQQVLLWVSVVVVHLAVGWLCVLLRIVRGVEVVRGCVLCVGGSWYVVRYVCSFEGESVLKSWSCGSGG